MWRLQMSDSDGYSRSPHWKGWCRMFLMDCLLISIDGIPSGNRRPNNGPSAGWMWGQCQGCRPSNKVTLICPSESTAKNSRPNCPLQPSPNKFLWHSVELIGIRNHWGGGLHKHLLSQLSSQYKFTLHKLDIHLDLNTKNEAWPKLAFLQCNYSCNIGVDWYLVFHLSPATNINASNEVHTPGRRCTKGQHRLHIHASGEWLHNKEKWRASPK